MLSGLVLIVRHSKSGSSCHERAPRGSKTGTQRIKGTSKRAIIRAKLCEHIETFKVNRRT